MNKNYLTSKEKLDDLVITEDSYLNLELFEDSIIRITIMPGCGLELVVSGKDHSKDLEIKLGEASILNYYEISKNAAGSIKIDMEKRSEINFHTSNIVSKDLELNLSVEHIGEDTKARIVNHAVNLNGSKIVLNVGDKIAKESYRTVSSQDNKIIDLADGDNKIRPNLIVDNDDVEANHSSYVGRFKDEELFYLCSRGLSEKEAKNLLIGGFLMNNMNLSSKDMSIFKLFILENMEGSYE